MRLGPSKYLFPQPARGCATLLDAAQFDATRVVLQPLFHSEVRQLNSVAHHHLFAKSGKAALLKERAGSNARFGKNTCQPQPDRSRFDRRVQRPTNSAPDNIHSTIEHVEMTIVL
jgi:hypothetical protein